MQALTKNTDFKKTGPLNHMFIGSNGTSNHIYDNIYLLPWHFNLTHS